MHVSSSRAVARISLVALGVALALALGVMPAAAAPNTISLEQLRTELAAAPGGVLPGHFLTVLKGSTIVSIDCNVLAVTGAPTDVVDPEVELVFFEATGPEIDLIGGIASGMSGSPVYVNIGGEDKLVGAVSYGDSMTKGGYGFATPIEAMEHVEALGSTDTMLSFGKSVATSAGMKTGVVLTSDALKSVSAVSAGLIPIKPLSSLYIGGISPKSAAYRAYAKRAAAKGFDIVPLVNDGLGTGRETYETTLQAGAACTVLAARGDLWVGGIGTVTYENDDNVMMFGHPFTGAGRTELYLSNAWITSTWPSTYFPYKFGVPGKLRGTVTQDRGAGVLGVIGEAPPEALVRARAYRSDTAELATSTVGLPDQIINSTSWDWYGIAPFAASIAASELFDTYPSPGSAVTTTTVTVSDGVDEFVITRTNLFDDSYEIPYSAVSDVDMIVSEMQSIKAAGFYDVRIVDIETEATLSATRHGATIVDVEAPKGIKRGANPLLISLIERGELETKTVEMTLTLPAGAPLNGQLTVYSGSGNYDETTDEVTSGSGGHDEPWLDEDRRTLAQAIADINATPTNNILSVSYGDPETDVTSVEATVSTQWYLSGSVSKTARTVSAAVYPRVISAGSKVVVYGWVEGVTGGTVGIYARTVGETTERLLTTAKLSPPGEESDGGDFDALVGPLEKTTVLRIAYAGDRESLAAQTSRTVTVSARVSLASSLRYLRRGTAVTLTANVRPATFGGSVSFERYVNGVGWRRIALRAAPSGTATYRFVPPAGSVKVRARTLGSATNTGGTSPIVTLTVR